ncbi:hypothetical protein Pyn_11976 [Prunus yedoensis var. nudiflora]|uniref:Uncharacterized protein n=1 Tax=Prunus yedoensis var. nudiflora TaxID=2094558 RepID=A0A314XZI9_PRUYE|nr:hypothetical protein Pyn_11976 [Prunus yedoensis var. nudiflora]
MASGYFCIIAKKLTILLVVIVMVFSSLGMADLQCQAKCEDQPDCNAFCQRIGFKGGDCQPPFYQFCCCET